MSIAFLSAPPQKKDIVPLIAWVNAPPYFLISFHLCLLPLYFTMDIVPSAG